MTSKKHTNTETGVQMFKVQCRIRDGGRSVLVSQFPWIAMVNTREVKRVKGVTVIMLTRFTPVPSMLGKWGGEGKDFDGCVGGRS